MVSHDASTGSGHDALPVALRNDRILWALYEYWRGQCAGRAYPDRADISPHGMGPKLLPHVGLAELDTADLTKSRLRLVGTAIVEELGFDPTGQRVIDYAHGDYMEMLVALASDMLRHRRPVFGESGFRLREDRFLVVRRIYLPLSHGGSDPVMLLFGQTFHRPPDPAALDTITRVVLPG